MRSIPAGPRKPPSSSPRFTIAEAADLLEQLNPDHRARRRSISWRPPSRRKSCPNSTTRFSRTSPNVSEPGGWRGAIAGLESDDALLLISSLDEARQRQAMQAIPAALRAALEQGLAYPEDSAGRLMQRDLVAVPTFWTVGETIDYMREADDLPNDFYDIFVVDPGHRPVGVVALSHVLRTRRPVPMRDLSPREVATVPVGMDQEEVAYAFAQKDLVSAPVVDDCGAG